VVNILLKSPAYEAGVRPGDMITGLGNRAGAERSRPGQPGRRAQARCPDSTRGSPRPPALQVKLAVLNGRPARFNRNRNRNRSSSSSSSK